MEYNFIQPSAFLSPYIKYYWVLNNLGTLTTKYSQRIVPNGFADLMFYFEEVPEYVRNKTIIKSRTLVNGQQDGYYDINITGNLSLLSVVFKPQGAKLFFNLPLNELLNQTVPAEFLFNRLIDKLQDKLNGTKELTQKIFLIETFLQKQLSQQKGYEYDRMEHCIQQIDSARGVISVEKLASETCLSRKQFERTFSDFVGISPKKFLRTIRFQNTLLKKHKSAINNLAALACESGYYDQSHMTSDFKNLTGYTPKQFFDICDPFSDYFST